MNDRDDAVDAWLDELGAADVPQDLARVVGDHVRARGARRSGRLLPLLAAAAAAATIAVGALLVGTRPSDPATPSPPVAVTSPDATRSPGPTAPTAPTVSGRPAPTPDATVPDDSIVFTVDLLLPLVDVRRARVEIADQSGRLVGAEVAIRAPAGTAGDTNLGPLDLDIRGVPGQPNAAWVGWTGGVCDYRRRLTITASGDELLLQEAPRRGCDLAGIGQGVILAFDAPIDAAGIGGREIDAPLVAVSDLRPTTIAFADPLTGWVGGTTPHGDAMVLRTVDGGRTWSISGLGEGAATEISAMGPTAAMASHACPTAPLNCSEVVSRWDEDFGGWGGAYGGHARSIDFVGQLGAMVHSDDELLVNDDGGDTDWQPVESPCGEPYPTMQDAERVDSERMLVLCVGEGSGGSQPKALFGPGSRLGTFLAGDWRTVASTDDGGLPLRGTATQIDLRDNAVGWLWGSRMRLHATEDGGVTWRSLGLVDGEVRSVLDASYLGGGTGYALVHDPDRGETILYATTDESTWNELGAWPLRP